MSEHGPSVDLWVCERVHGFLEKNAFCGMAVANDISDCSVFSQISKDTLDTGVDDAWIRMDAEKTLLSRLEEGGSDWLVLDLRSSLFSHFRVRTEKGSALLSRSCGKRFVEHLEATGGRYLSKSVRPWTNYSPEDLTSFLERLKAVYGGNIILVETHEAFSFMGLFSKVPVDVAKSRERTSVEYELMERFILGTGCHYIKCPFGTLFTDFKGWDVFRGKYLEAYGKYLNASIRHIIGTDVPDPSYLDRLFMEVSMEFDRLRSNELRDKVRSDERLLNLIQDGNTDALADTVNALTVRGSEKADLYLAYMHDKGLYFGRNTKKASRHIQNLVESGSIGSFKELIPLLWGDDWGSNPLFKGVSL
ncbi:MAG: hypothetical protein MJZ68_05275 [archaeon]|nr:hypothetical protein [archaeon]